MDLCRIQNRKDRVGHGICRNARRSQFCNVNLNQHRASVHKQLLHSTGDADPKDFFLNTPVDSKNVPRTDLNRTFFGYQHQDCSHAAHQTRQIQRKCASHDIQLQNIDKYKTCHKMQDIDQN